MTQLSTPPTGGPEARRSPNDRLPIWITAIVLTGAALTATGALLAIFSSSEHLNLAGQNYADYFITRNLAVAALLALMVLLRARRGLTALMALTALVQTMDAATAITSGRSGLVPIDLIFASAFAFAANRLSDQPLWRSNCWNETTPSTRRQN
ncbi:MAG: hypothetical protein ACRDWT_08970 [Jatrophihabitantaceae bacterium]